MNEKKDTLTIEIKPSFLIILAVTLVLLVGLIVGLFIVMNRDGDRLGHGGAGAPPGGGGSIQTTTASSEDIPVGNNGKPLFPTVETRESYKINTTGDTVKLTGDDFVKSNAVLVKVTKDSLTSVVEKSADEKIYPASMTKVMTLLVACENVKDLDAKLTITSEHIRYVGNTNGASSFFGLGSADLPGEKITVRDALYLISYESDTIACLLMAEHIAGSEEAFVELMNQKAQSLGLTGTHFVNCTGLYNENHYSTCNEIAAITAYAMDNEMASSILLSIEAYKIKGENNSYTLWGPGWYRKRFDEKNQLSTVTLIGGKTGHIDQTGASLVSVAKAADGTFYINVVSCRIGAFIDVTPSTNEVKKIYNTYAK